MRSPSIYAALAIGCACTPDGSRGSLQDAPPAAKAPAEPTDEPSRRTSMIAFTDEAWPEVPFGLTDTGAMWQTHRHETIAVHFALPPGAKVRKERLQFGHPVVFVDLGEVTAQITYSSGAGVFGEGLAQDPPTVVGQPVEHLNRSEDNTTVWYRRGEERVVKGWLRGAECSADGLTKEQAEAAFSFCSSVRVPPPGDLAQANKVYSPPFLLAPMDAVVIESHGVPMLYAGHFVAKVLNEPCANEDELRAAHANNFALERRTMNGGELLVGTSFATYQDVRFQTNTSIWATRNGTCCVASILESLTPPTEAQIEYVAHLCDGSR